MNEVMPVARLRKLTTTIVSAYVQKHTVKLQDVVGIIGEVHAALEDLAQPNVTVPEPVVEKQKPAVPIRKSIQHEYLVSLEDGRHYKSLKRHLASKYGLTPDEYRQKWGLPADYPMIAPAYAALRSAIAHDMGLGQKTP